MESARSMPAAAIKKNSSIVDTALRFRARRSKKEQPDNKNRDRDGEVAGTENQPTTECTRF